MITTGATIIFIKKGDILFELR